MVTLGTLRVNRDRDRDRCRRYKGKNCTKCSISGPKEMLVLDRCRDSAIMPQPTLAVDHPCSQ